MTAHRTFYEWARLEPQRPALIVPGSVTLTAGELLARVNALSHALRELGLSSGDAVAVVLRNGPEYIELSLATAQVGMYLVPVNWHLAPPEIAYILRDSGAKIVVAEAAAAATVPADALPLHLFAVDGTAEGWSPYRSLGANSATGDPPDREAGVTMGYTSGTTGRPKGVRAALPGIDPEAMIGEFMTPFFAAYGVRRGDGVHLVCSPLYHAAPGGHAMAFLHLGNTLVLDEGFDAQRFLRYVERYRVTSTHMVPTHFHRLLRLPDETRTSHDMSSLEAVILAGAPCPVETKQQMFDWLGPIIWEYLASTEGMVSRVTPAEWLAKPGTVGRPVDGAIVKIITEDGGEAGPGEPGTIYFGRAGAGVSFEYHGDPQKTTASRRGNLATVGDYGYFERDGYLFLLDRRSDLILSGGVNIYPAEVEQHLIAHPAVADVAVIGLPDEEWGQVVVAVVQLTSGYDGSSALVAELDAYCRDGLARFKRPRRIMFVAEFPRTETGKLQRRKLRELFDGSPA